MLRLRVPYWASVAQAWLARRIAWIPEPGLPRRLSYSRWDLLVYRWRTASRKQRGWWLFFAFWGAAVLLAIYGNLLPD
jgi:hypothetical protein